MRRVGICSSLGAISSSNSLTERGAAPVIRSNMPLYLFREARIMLRTMYGVATIFAACLFNSAVAQTYPDKPMRIITAAAGGGSDYMARVIAQGISGPLGQPVVVDNRAGGIVAAEVVA